MEFSSATYGTKLVHRHPHIIVGINYFTDLSLRPNLLSLCSRASLGASRLQDLHLSMLPCSQRIVTPSVTDVIESSCATLCLSLKPSDRRFSTFSKSFHLKRSFIWWNFGIYFDSVTSVLLGGEQKQGTKKHLSEDKCCCCCMRKETHLLEGSTEFGLNASFIFFNLIYNIIDFRAIVKGESTKFL